MNEITMEVRRTIKVGSKYHIAPTLAYMGVLPGTVEVLEIAKKEDMVSSDAKMCIQAHVDCFYGVEICEVMQAELDGIWVSYEYIDGQDEGINAFPIGEFLRHTSEYI